MLTGNKTNKMTKFWWGHAIYKSINECIVYSSGYLISWPDHKCLLLFFFQWIKTQETTIEHLVGLKELLLQRFLWYQCHIKYQTLQYYVERCIHIVTGILFLTKKKKKVKEDLGCHAHGLSFLNFKTVFFSDIKYWSNYIYLKWNSLLNSQKTH